MNPSEQEIESALRRAPRPNPPANLKRQLLAQMKLPVTRPGSQRTTSPLSGAGWFRRWWPALAPATASLALAVVVTVQRTEIQELKESIQTLSQASTPEVGPTVPANSANNEQSVSDSVVHEQQEITRLKELIRQLSAEIGQLEQVQKENETLRVQLSAPPPGIPQEVMDAQEQFLKARERAMEIACVNNLKQFGLAVRMWALDNSDVNPPDIICMSNMLSTPKILVCPAETNRPAATSWAAYTSANCSYEYLAAAGSDKEPTRVLSRCPIHGNIGLVDGSVQRGVAKNHPDSLIQRDGKLYYEYKERPAKP